MCATEVERRLGLSAESLLDDVLRVAYRRCDSLDEAEKWEAEDWAELIHECAEECEEL